MGCTIEHFSRHWCHMQLYICSVCAGPFMYACIMCAHLRKMVGSQSPYMYIICTGHVYWCSRSSIQLCIHTVQVYIILYIYIYIYIYLIYNRYAYYSSTIRVLNTCMREWPAGLTGHPHLLLEVQLHSLPDWEPPQSSRLLGATYKSQRNVTTMNNGT